MISPAQVRSWQVTRSWDSLVRRSARVGPAAGADDDVCRQTREVAPRTHNLSRLVSLVDLDVTEAHVDTLAAMSAFSIAGRYPGQLNPVPTPAEAEQYLERAGELYRWLIQQL